MKDTPLPIEERPMTVSQLTRAGKNLLETYLPRLWVEGELSNISKPASGHWYFTLKDAKAQVRCAMFRNRNMYVKFQPEAGQKVLLKGKASLYEGRGDFQILADELQPAGQGDLQRAFDELKAKLLKQGLFDAQLKKALPAWPKQIAVITSATGAVVHDIARVLARRCPTIEVNILPVAVQGEQAAPAIVDALRLANSASLGDVIILARGGGSLEDLWAFNEEKVALAIFESDLPVISAVGHEVDFTIADFVADIRAPTPSVAAELASPNIADTKRAFQICAQQLVSGLRQLTARHQQHLKYLRAKLKHPGEQLQGQAQKLDYLEARLQKAMRLQLDAHTQTLKKCHRQLLMANPQTSIGQIKKQLNDLAKRMPLIVRRQYKSKQKDLHHVAQRLNAVSPLNTLDRGYAIVENEDGRVIKDIEQLEKAARIKTRLANGWVHSTVDKTEAYSN